MVESNRPKILAFKPPFIYFGFVDVGENVDRCLEIRNVSQRTVILKFRLKSDKGFKVIPCSYFFNFYLPEQNE